MAGKSQGKLKIYLGMSAGVGKTYAMLKDAQDELESGTDIIAGYIEPHGRNETENLIRPFEVLQVKAVEHNGIILKEFNLEAALQRRPNTILVDELAHTNAPGSLHNKRWLDIKTLLDEGINVYSTLNIQHIDSVSEMVSSLCGIQVQETVPDSILSEADSIEVIDIPPEELIDRLKEGKIYPAHKVESALSNFFKLGTLLALREILLRKAAEKIDRDVLQFRQSQALRDSWATSDRMLVAIGANRFAKKLLQKSARLAASRKAELIAVYVQTPHLGILSAEAQELLDDALQTAQSMKIKVERCVGTDIVAEILKIATSKNVSLIIAGKIPRNRIKELFNASIADNLIKRSGNIDVLLMTAEEQDFSLKDHIGRETIIPNLRSTLISLLIVGTCTLLAFVLDPILELASLCMIYILGAVLVAKNFSRTESILSSICSILLLNFLFIEPRYSFSVNDPAYLLTFIAMLAVSLSISKLVTQVKLQNQLVENRERRTIALYEAGKSINSATSRLEILLFTRESILKLLEADCGILLKNAELLKIGVPSKSIFENDPQEFAVARFVMDKGKAAGITTDVLPGATALYLPIKTESTLYGVAAIKPTNPEIDRHLIPTFESILQQSAICLERIKLEQEAREAKVKAESETMRNLVLSSVSHDFRTPLTVIEGSAEQICTDPADKEKVRELGKSIVSTCKRLSRLVVNALSLAKFEQGEFKLKLEWESLEELVGQALEKMADSLKDRMIRFDYPEDLPLLKFDAIIMDQLITNILENSVIHGKGAKVLKISITTNNKSVTLCIEDDGPGMSSSRSEAVATDTTKNSGSGLGLLICNMIAKLHKGEFDISSVDGSGTIAKLTLPLPVSS